MQVRNLPAGSFLHLTMHAVNAIVPQLSSKKDAAEKRCGKALREPVYYDKSLSTGWGIYVEQYNSSLQAGHLPLHQERDNVPTCA